MAANSLNRKSVSKAKGLSEIVTGIINEFNKANVSIDLMKAHWKNIYDNHSVLSGSEPSKIQLISAQISIPLAFDTVASETIQSPVLNIDQLKSLFPTKLDPALVHKTSKTILEKSFGNMNFALTNQALKKNLVVRIHSQKIPSLNPERDLQWGKLAQYQKEAADYVASDNNAKFIYTAEELGKVSPDKIFRIDLTLNIN